MLKIFFNITLLIIICAQSLRSESTDSSYWNAHLVRSYVHNSELQRRWAFSFMASHLKLLHGDERILDIGCGDGKITADIAKWVPEGSVLGIDLSESMIAWAQKQYHALEYPNLTFQVGSFLEPNVEGRFDLIVSFCALQHSSDQQKALTILLNLLKPNGKLLILVPTRNNPAWNAARVNVQSCAQWASYWKNFAPRKSFSAQQYAEFLHQANFSDINAATLNTMDPFIDKTEIIEWLCGTFVPQVPEAKLHEFYNEWIDEYVRLAPDAIGEDGVIYARLGYTTMVAVRKSI